MFVTVYTLYTWRCFLPTKENYADLSRSTSMLRLHIPLPINKRTPIYIASFRPVCQLYLDFLTGVIAAAIMHRSLKYSASKENPTKSGLNTKNMFTEKTGFGVGCILYCVTMAQILSISPLCQHKVDSSFGCLKADVIAGPLLSCLCPGEEKEMWHLG